MNRRAALQRMAIIAAGSALLPYCREAAKPGISLKNIKVSEGQQEMLAALTETIIPKTNTFLGAGDLKSHEFLLIMVDECATPEDQEIFTDGLKAFEDACEKKFGTSFLKCTARQRSRLLKELENANGDNNSAAKFYNTCKGYTLQSFTTSKEFLVDVKKWKMVPGSNFRGCVKI